ncbi:MAG TPA: hypothetical protein PKD90_02145 [Phnomibacter sp.]|nr:hypothetical protein [Phnomibacter sp.]
MKKGIFTGLGLLTLLAWQTTAHAQCSICTKTASQLGRQSAEGLNGGILYLMILPFAIASFIGYRWWRHQKQVQKEEAAS